MLDHSPRGLVAALRPHRPIRSRPYYWFVAHHSAYGEPLTLWRFRSGAPSVHHTGPRSPSAILALSTALRASASSSGLPDACAALTARRAVMSSLRSAS